jgi:hypothetical protein
LTLNHNNWVTLIYTCNRLIKYCTIFSLISGPPSFLVPIFTMLRKKQKTIMIPKINSKTKQKKNTKWNGYITFSSHPFHTPRPN